jgi:hypothetical protein
MKNLSDPAAQREIFSRLSSLSPEDRRRWGSMSVHQMVCHLHDGYRMALAQKPVATAATRIPRPLLKWLALRAPTHWPKGFPSATEIAQEGGGTPPADFQRDLSALLDSLKQFCAGMPHPELKHPYFGNMNASDWMRWGYLHADHHLRQFGR